MSWKADQARLPPAGFCVLLLCQSERFHHGQNLSWGCETPLRKSSALPSAADS